MMQRLKLFLIAASVLCAGLSLAQAPSDPPDEPPVRLKKKNKTEPDKTEPKKPPMQEEKKEPPKKADEKEEPEPPAPQEDEAEVLARLAKNVERAEERIANKELNDGTRQLQEDILKDLDSLIRAAENPQGGSDNENQDQANNGEKSKSQSGGSMGKQTGRPSSSSRASRNKQGRGSRQANKSSKQNGSNSGGQQGNSQPNGQSDQQPNSNGGGGGKSQDKLQDKNADLYKDIWGHLPESLRAEMNAYSNDKQFMAKYDELIKRYYRSSAEQGRRKGD